MISYQERSHKIEGGFVSQTKDDRLAGIAIAIYGGFYGSLP